MEKLPSLKKSLSSLSSEISRASSPKKRKNDLKRMDSDLQWYDKYAPTSIHEVAVHKKKVEDVRKELESMISKNTKTKILLLTGPSGSAKSSTIKLLSDELIPKYRTDGINFRSNKLSNWIEYTNNDETISSAKCFDDFLDQCKYRIGGNLSVIIIEELPNIFHDEVRVKFHNSLLKWIYVKDPMPPLVICLTECELPSDNQNYSIETSFIAETVLCREILKNPFVLRIKFNPINTTLIMKQLKKIAAYERKSFELSKWKERDHYIEKLSQKCGDIRSAIATLQFWSSSSYNEIINPRESLISYFHAIGKVMYGSKDISDDFKMINELMLSDHLLNDNFKLGLLENYSKYNKDNFILDVASEITGSLSQSDIVRPPPYNIHELFEYSLRKIRYTFHQINDLKSNSGPTKFPREWIMRKLKILFRDDAETFKNIEFYKHEKILSTRDIDLYYSYYGPFIRKKRNFKKMSIIHYLKNLDPTSNELKKIKDKYVDILSVDDTIDILERIGGCTGSIQNSYELLLQENELFFNSRNQTRAKMKYLMNCNKQKFAFFNDTNQSNNFDNEFINDPLIDSENEFHDDENTLDDDSVYEILSQRVPRNTNILHNENLSDSDLENL